MENERTAWNRRYRQGSHLALKPDPFLVHAFDNFIQPLYPNGGIGLDIAGGVGRHAIWLARQDWKITLVDISEVPPGKARQNAGGQTKRIAYEQTDLTKFKAGRKKYDLILVFFYLERRIFEQLSNSLRPGGLLIYKTYTRLQRNFEGGPTHPMHLLKANELLRVFDNLQVLYYQETVHRRGLAEFVGRKSGA